MQFSYSQLSDKQREQARAMFLDAGSGRDNYWYETGYDGNVLCRNRDRQEPGDVENEGLEL